jgi:hypothetical protein
MTNVQFLPTSCDCPIRGRTGYELETDEAEEERSALVPAASLFRRQRPARPCSAAARSPRRRPRRAVLLAADARDGEGGGRGGVWAGRVGAGLPLASSPPPSSSSLPSTPPSSSYIKGIVLLKAYNKNRCFLHMR